MTSIEWLIQVFAHNDIIDHKLLSTREDKYKLYKRLVEQSKELHKQEIMDAHSYGQFYCNGCDESTAEHYYSETFKKD